MHRIVQETLFKQKRARLDQACTSEPQRAVRHRVSALQCCSLVWKKFTSAANRSPTDATHSFQSLVANNAKKNTQTISNPTRFPKNPWPTRKEPASSAIIGNSRRAPNAGFQSPNIGLPTGMRRRECSDAPLDCYRNRKCTYSALKLAARRRLGDSGFQ